jgi:hypothetical protein
MRKAILVGLFGLFGAFASAKADPANGPPQTAPFQAVEAPSNDPDQIVCHTMGAPTGSRIGASRECHSAKDWEMRRLEHQRAVNSQQLHSLLSNEPGG